MGVEMAWLRLDCAPLGASIRLAMFFSIFSGADLAKQCLFPVGCEYDVEDCEGEKMYGACDWPLSHRCQEHWTGRIEERTLQESTTSAPGLSSLY